MTAPSKSVWVEIGLLWLPLGVAVIAGVYAHTNLTERAFVQNAPNQYGHWILTVFVTGLAGTLAGLACLVPEIWSSKSAKGAAVPVSFLIALSFICGGVLLVQTENAEHPGIPDLQEDFMLVGFAVASLSAVALKVFQERNAFWIARLLAVELPATVTISIIVVAKYLIYNSSNPGFQAWLSGQHFYLGKELAEKAQVNSIAATALRDSFWIGVSFGVVGVQLITNTIAATAIDLWRLNGIEKRRTTRARTCRPPQPTTQ